MEARLLQDWVTLSGSGTALIQSASEWLDLADAREAMIYLECAAISGTPHVWYQTAPTRDSNQFTTIAKLTLAASTTPVVTSLMVYDAPPVPLMRWLRWRAPLDVGQSATFRITVMPYGR